MDELVTPTLEQFLQTARWPTLHEWQPTFFSIAGIEEKEVPLSNVYAFFFDSEEVHGLGPLFLQALLNVVATKAPGRVAEWPALDGPVRVAREYGVKNQQRIDLLVHDGPSATIPKGGSYAVLVENKVNHWLANDLTNYWDSIPEPARKLGVVLGVRREWPAAPWVFVSHAELVRAVQQRLGPQLSRINARYLPVLLHFLDYLTSMSEQQEDFMKAFDFAQRHRAQLAQAQRVIGELTGQALGKVVVAAFGEGYAEQVCFPDRVDVRLTQSAPLRYVVYYGNILNLSKDPGFAITLYAPDATKEQVVRWQTYLQAQSAADAARLAPLPWFGRSSLLIGRSYPFTGTKLTELQAQIEEAILKHWKPLEDAWIRVDGPPAGESQAAEGA
ncbi:PD-(D/E)XK nuclease family protein [Hymenobacter sp. BT559]|uniref:PD-(D/E)XK nuclease family protein n=1 Tax=Hymenobacter sp. BT559 TaxID=2795729 RepID=UPI0018EABB47|nr:PD-(D/E)XK nuclease family protein [Hymenobacter sp. BT559]MBJ6146376.1 PD-(D/E)XK nuclease family protein [Hymenobacter sp. BT559]